MPDHDADQPQRLRAVDAAVASAVRLLWMRPARAGRTRILAVDGPSGAGKSTLAARLSLALDGAPVLRLDDVYPGWDGLDQGVARLVQGVLEPLAHGRPARVRRYDWVHEQDAEAYSVPAAPVVVLEGCGAGAGTCRPYLSALVWVDAPAALRLERAIARDGEGYRPHWRRWADQERAHFDREGTAQRADLVLDTSA